METKAPRKKKQSPEHIANLKQLISVALKQSWTAQIARERLEASTRKHLSQAEEHTKKAALAWEAVSVAATAVQLKYAASV
jgi:hypothetical protein